MLGKLLKYEFIYLAKDFTRTYIIYGFEVILLAILINIPGGRSLTYLTLVWIFGAIYYIFTMLLALLTISHNVRRFKKNMFSHEGYLTNTLPVTPAQHVIAKVIVGAVNYVLSFVVIYLGMLLLSTGMGEAGSFVRSMERLFESLYDFGLLLPTFLMMATGYLSLLLLCYLISSINSMIGASKGLSAVLAIGIIIAYILIITMVTSSSANIYGNRGTSAMYILSLFHLIGAGVEFACVLHIIKNKLNLQ